jgi:xanthine dehydrogenase YagR molybdenum-binding subunit
MDIGRVVNPLTCRNQIVGGVVMGIGQALFEQTVLDPRSGRPVTDNLADYLAPVSGDVPPIEVCCIDEPNPELGVLGAFGAGEIGITGAAAAVANAVFHATGLRVRDLPITPDTLLQLG